MSRLHTAFYFLILNWPTYYSPMIMSLASNDRPMDLVTTTTTTTMTTTKISMPTRTNKVSKFVLHHRRLQSVVLHHLQTVSTITPIESILLTTITIATITIYCNINSNNSNSNNFKQTSRSTMARDIHTRQSFNTSQHMASTKGCLCQTFSDKQKQLSENENQSSNKIRYIQSCK